MDKINAHDKVSDFENYCFSPRECTKLGEKVGEKVKIKKIGIGYTADSKSKANAMAVMAGVSSKGINVWDFGETFESELYFLSCFASLGAGIYIDSSLESIHIYENKGANTQALQNKSFSIGVCEYGKIFDMSKIKMLYCDKLIDEAREIEGANCTIKSDNPNISLLMYDAVKQDNRGEIFFKINRQGTSLNVYTKKTGVVPFSALKNICALNEIKNKNEIFLPFNSPKFLYDLARKNKAKIIKEDSFSLCELWQKDALFMAVKILSILSKENIDFYDLYKEIPPLYKENKIINLSFSKNIEKRLIDSGFTVGKDGFNGIYVKKEAVSACISPVGMGKSKLTVECDKAENAQNFYTQMGNILGKN